MNCEPVQTVSIITPSYQQREFIEQTLLSVVGQRGEFDLDYIVVDGGSTDGTVELLQQFESGLADGRIKPGCRNIRFRWVSEKDNGQANAINKGFCMATGDVIAWLNSDDLYPNNQVLAKCVGFFRRYPDSRFLYGKGFGIDRSGKVTGEEWYVTDFTADDLGEIDMILQPAAFWRREVYETIGLLNESLHYVLDWEYWLRCQRRFRLDFLDEFLACNRRYDETKTSAGGIIRKREIAQLLLEMGKFTERAIQAYLATPIDVPAAAPYKPRAGLEVLLSPGRNLEKRVRQFRKSVLRPAYVQRPGESRPRLSPTKLMLLPTRYLERGVRRVRNMIFRSPAVPKMLESEVRRAA